MNKNLARIILIAAGAIMGIGFVVNKYILDSGWNESQLIFIRFFVATILIFLFYFKIQENKCFIREQKSSISLLP